MSEWRSAAHVRYNLWYHFVWSPKYRHRVLKEKEIKIISKWIKDAIENKDDKKELKKKSEAVPKGLKSGIIRIPKIVFE